MNDPRVLVINGRRMPAQWIAPTVFSSNVITEWPSSGAVEKQTLPRVRILVLRNYLLFALFEILNFLFLKKIFSFEFRCRNAICDQEPVVFISSFFNTPAYTGILLKCRTFSLFFMIYQALFRPCSNKIVLQVCFQNALFFFLCYGQDTVTHFLRPVGYTNIIYAPK